MADYKVSVTKLIEELHLEAAYLPMSSDELFVTSAEVNRPALVLDGFTEYFERARIQIVGRVEMAFLDKLDAAQRLTAAKNLFELKPVAVVVTRKLAVPDEFMSLAKQFSVPLLTSAEKTSDFMSEAISYLSVELAPRISRHGVLVEVYGEGVLLLGESGVGKSETAIELVKRGHRLIADDVVELRRVSNRTLVGSAPENIRHFVELRGIGIVNVRRLFGMGSVKMTERVDIIIELEQWQANKNYSVIAPETQTMSILEVPVPKLTVPVRPGRNLAIIIEVAAMNNRQLKMGYSPINELMNSLGLADEYF